MNTLVVGTPSIEILNELYKNNKLNVKFVIHSVKKAYRDLDAEDLVKYNFPEKLKFDFSSKAQKNYQKFFIENFNSFSFQFIRRGLKSTDIHELRNHFANFYYGFTDILVKNKIDLIIFFAPPHLGYDYVLYKIAKNLKIKTLMTMQSNNFIHDKFFIFKNPEEYGQIINKITGNTSSLTEADILKEFKDYKTLHDNYKKKIYDGFNKVDLKKIGLKKLILRILINLKIISRKDVYYYQKKYISSLEKYEISIDEIINIKNKKKIIYFPLQMQPEGSTSLFGFFYEDQVAVVEKLRSLLNLEWTIIIKEHPRQTFYQRDDGFFKRLKQIPQVFFANRSIEQKELVKISDLMATISGTVVIEAALQNKKTLVFGSGRYNSISHAYKVDMITNYNDIKKFLSKKLTKKKFIEDLNKVNSSLFKGVIARSKKRVLNSRNNAKKVVNSIIKFINLNF